MFRRTSRDKHIQGFGQRRTNRMKVKKMFMNSHFWISQLWFAFLKPFTITEMIINLRWWGGK